MYSIRERMSYVLNAVDEMTSAEQFITGLKELTVGNLLEPVRSARQRWMNFFGYKGLKPDKPLIYGNAEYTLNEFEIDKAGRTYMRLIGKKNITDHETGAVTTENFVTPRIPLSKEMFEKRDPAADLARELAREDRIRAAESVGHAVGSAVVHTPLAALLMLAYSAGAPMHSPHSLNAQNGGFHNGASLEVSDAFPSTFRPGMYLNADEFTTSNETVTDRYGRTSPVSWNEFFANNSFSPVFPSPDEVAVAPEDTRLASGTAAIGGVEENDSTEPDSTETDRTH